MRLAFFACLHQLILEVTVYLRKARCVMIGVLLAASLYPSAPIVMVLIGTLKGSEHVHTQYVKMWCMQALCVCIRGVVVFQRTRGGGGTKDT